MNAVRKLLWAAVFGAAVATATAGVLALSRARPPLPDLGPVEERPLNPRIWIGSLVDPGCDGACRRTIDALKSAAKALEGEKDVGFARIEPPPPGMATPDDLRSDIDPPDRVTGERAADLHDRLRALVPPPKPPEGEFLLPAFGYVGDWALTGIDGKPFGGGDLKGKAWIADFVFTRCAGPCPVMCEGMDKLVKLLPADPRLKFVSFSVDPDYDTPEVLREFAAQWKADPERWKFVTGTGVFKLAYDRFKLMARPNPEPTPGNQIIHSTRFTLVDDKGWMRGLYVYDFTQPETLPATLEAIVRDTRALLETPERVVTHTHEDRFYLVDRAGRLRAVCGEADLHRLVVEARRLARSPEKLQSLRTLPRLNAALNGTSFLFLTAGAPRVARLPRVVRLLPHSRGIGPVPGRRLGPDRVPGPVIHAHRSRGCGGADGARDGLAGVAEEVRPPHGDRALDAPDLALRFAYRNPRLRFAVRARVGPRANSVANSLRVRSSFFGERT